MATLNTKKRGRPSKEPTDALRARVWFADLAEKSDKASGYAMECSFAPDKVRRYNGVTERPCRFDKYKRGEHLPCRHLVEEIEELYPGTKEIIDHPFWSIAKRPPPSIECLHAALAALNPVVSGKLFDFTDRSRSTPKRNDDNYAESFKWLSQQGDIDALTACIGLIHEIELMGGAENYRAYTVATVNAFFRVAYQHPFDLIAEQLFEYLKLTIFRHPNDPVLSTYLESIDVQQVILSRSYVAHLIECLGVFPEDIEPPPACLHIAQRYLKQDVIECFWNCDTQEKWNRLKRLPDVRNLIRRLRKWERDEVIGPYRYA